MANGLSGIQGHPKVSQGRPPLSGYNFLLRVEAKYDLACRSVQAFRRENEYEYIQEGGLNDYVHILRKPSAQPSTLEVERYVLDNDADPLPVGAVLTMPLLLMVSRQLNKFEQARRSYAFTGCVVTGKEYSELNAENSGLMTEKIFVAYQEMFVIDEEGA